MNNEAIIQTLREENSKLKHELAILKKLIFGAKSERFIPQNTAPNQLNLFGELEINETKEQEVQSISYDRKKANKKHEGRNNIPEHFAVEEEIIEPEQDTTGMIKIGELVTETLKYTPASLIKRRIIRPKYANIDGEGVIIAKLPTRPIEKGIAESSLLSHIFVSKFVDHLPFYRQIQRFKRDYQWDLSSSTINDWFAACCTLMEPLYDHIKKEVLKSGYIQVDESPIKVLDNKKKGKSHQGYQWVYHSPEKKLILFNYRKGRGMNGPKELLGDYTGWLQSDGYTVYDQLGKQPQINLVGCMVHVRRKYHEALSNDKNRANKALGIFKQIYSHERLTKDMNNKQRYEYRNEFTKPLLKELLEWVDHESIKVLPASAIGKAMRYTVNQWPKIINILNNGRIELDNNLIENKIRPLALGRKNYLFAGSHKGAQRIAIMYTLFATCKANGINPYVWLKETLELIPDTKVSELAILVPGSKKL